MRLKKDEVKLTVDAVILAEKSKYGIDLPARNDKWEVIQRRAKLYQVVTLEFAEATATKKALSSVKGRDWRKLVIESNYATLIQGIRSNLLVV